MQKEDISPPFCQQKLVDRETIRVKRTTRPGRAAELLGLVGALGRLSADFCFVSLELRLCVCERRAFRRAPTDIMDIMQCTQAIHVTVEMLISNANTTRREKERERPVLRSGRKGEQLSKVLCVFMWGFWGNCQNSGGKKSGKEDPRSGGLQEIQKHVDVVETC